MSYAQGTEHYEFPQFVGSDRPTFVDFNAAFRTIDTKLYGLEGDASTVDGRLDTIEAALPVMDAATQSAQNTADSAKAEADTNAEHITALEVLTGQHTTQIANKLDSVAIAEQYDPNAGTYSVGDIVVYNGQRYRCTTQVSVAEPFDADKWTGEDVQIVLDELKEDVDYISIESDVYTTFNWSATGYQRTCYRVGKLVHLFVYAYGVSNFDGVLLSLDNASDRPASVCKGTMLATYSGTDTFGFCQIDPSTGRLQQEIGSTPSNITKFVADITYYTN